jgi:hypothetical protein
VFKESRGIDMESSMTVTTMEARYQYQNVRIDRCTGCGGVWLDQGELEALSPEAQTSWLGDLLSSMTGRGEDSR